MILGILNSISVMLCIYALVSKKYKTDDIRVTLLFLCLNIIFMRRLWVVLDPTYTLSTVYILVNYVAFIALYLVMSLVKKNVVLSKKDISRRIKDLLRPFFNKIRKTLSMK